MSSDTPELPSDRKQDARRGGYPIPFSTISTAGFIGRTQRGPVDEPVCVESFAEYLRYFGGHLAESALSHAIQDYFLHGGQRAVVVRVANRASRSRLELPGADGVLRLEARYPGRQEILRASIDYERAEDESSRFNLVLQRLGSAASRLVEDQELYPLVSTLPDETRFLGKVLRDSRLVRLAGPVPVTRPFATPPERPGDPVRYVQISAVGHDGDELTDYDIIGSNRDGTGLFAFRRGPRLDMLAVPMPPQRDLGATALIAATRFCESTRALLIWDPPCAWESADIALFAARRLGFGSTNVMAYFPRIRPRGTSSRHSGGLAACGAVAGMLARRGRRGIFGSDEDTDYTLRAALAPVLNIDTAQAQRLARYGINSFVHTSGGSTRLVGRLTLGAAGSTRSPEASLDRQRLANFVLNSVDDALAAVAAETDLAVAQQRLEQQLQRFFDGLYQRGALQGRTPARAYFVKHVPGARVRAAPGSATALSGIAPSGIAPAEIRFGFALGPGAFREYAIRPDPALGWRLKSVRPLEADQLYR